MNQIELHPLLPQTELVEFCRDAGIHVQAFASLGGGDSGAPLLEHHLVKAIAASLGRTPAQVLLKWALLKGFSVIPKTSSVARMKENLLLDFAISTEQLSSLDGLSSGRRLTWRGIAPDTIL